MIGLQLFFHLFFCLIFFAGFGKRRSRIVDPGLREGTDLQMDKRRLCGYKTSLKGSNL
jgi:hypothetical protein